MTAPVDLEELKKEQKDRSDYGYFYSDIPIDRLLALIAELEAARVDAARYRWLRDGHKHYLILFSVGTPLLREHGSIDAAIDAARKDSA